jgi:hypothetical protein
VCSGKTGMRQPVVQRNGLGPHQKQPRSCRYGPILFRRPQMPGEPVTRRARRALELVVIRAPPHITAHAVLLHQLAHEIGPAIILVCRQGQTCHRQTHQPGRAGPNAPTTPWRKPPVNAPPTTTTPQCAASPACSPIWPPSAPTRSNPPTICPHSPRSPPPNPIAAARLRSARRFTLPRLHVVITHTGKTTKPSGNPPTCQHNRGNFGLAVASILIPP